MVNKAKGEVLTLSLFTTNRSRLSRKPFFQQLGYPSAQPDLPLLRQHLNLLHSFAIVFDCKDTTYLDLTPTFDPDVSWKCGNSIDLAGKVLSKP